MGGRGEEDGVERGTEGNTAFRALGRSARKAGRWEDPDPSPNSSRPARPGGGSTTAAATSPLPQSTLPPSGAPVRPLAYGAAAGPNLLTTTRRARTTPPADWGEQAHSPLLPRFWRLFHKGFIPPHLLTPTIDKITETMGQSCRKINNSRHVATFYVSLFPFIFHSHPFRTHDKLVR